MSTISINYNIIDLFKERNRNLIEDKFNCEICQELEYNQEWYQCNEGHTGCHSCWNKILSNNVGLKQCHSCRLPISSFSIGLSRNRYIEKDFKNQKIYCPYIYNDGLLNNADRSNKLEIDESGCKEKIKLGELKDHIKICNSRFVKCGNIGCGNISRYHIHLEHEKQCGYAIIQCKLCKIEIKKSELANHSNTCPFKRIICFQCPKDIYYCDLKEHVDNDCQNTIIPCELKEFGCNDEIKRSELSTHLEKVNHTIFLLRLINKQKQQLDEYKKQSQESDNRYNNILNKLNLNEISYSNSWVITDFKQKILYESQCVSPSFNVHSYCFQLSTIYSGGNQYFRLLLNGPENGKTKTKFSITLLHNKNANFNFFQEYEFDVNRFGYGPGIQFSMLTDNFILSDGSLKIDFTINIAKQMLIS